MLEIAYQNYFVKKKAFFKAYIYIILKNKYHLFMPIIYEKVGTKIHLIWNKEKRQKFEAEFIYSAGGSWFEKSQDRGKKHLLEHCIVSRTADMNFEKFKDYQFKENIFFNAYTAPVVMGLNAQCHNSNALETLEIVLQMGASPVFDEQILEQEKQIVLREITERRGEPAYKLHFEIAKAVFSPQSLENHEVLGDSKMVEQTSTEDFYNLQNQNLDQSHLLVCLNGGNDLDFGRIKTLLKTENEPKYEINYNPKNIFQDFSIKAVVSKYAHEQSEVHLYIPFDINFENKPILKIFSSLFLSFYGIIYDRLRNQLGLIYSLYANFDPDFQALYISFSCELESINKIYDEIQKLFSNFEKVFNVKKLEDLKSTLKKQILISSDNLSNQTQFITNSLLNYGEPETYKTYLKKLEQVSHQDIKKVYNLLGLNLKNKKMIISSQRSEADKIKC
jgi:predicted Zn-dependent peptidase